MMITEIDDIDLSSTEDRSGEQGTFAKMMDFGRIEFEDKFRFLPRHLGFRMWNTFRFEFKMQIELFSRVQAVS